MFVAVKRQKKDGGARGWGEAGNEGADRRAF